MTMFYQPKGNHLGNDSGLHQFLTSKIMNNGDDSSKVVTKRKKTKIYKWKRPSDKPKRPACAYNLLFFLERERLVRGDDVNQHPIYTEADASRAAEAQRHA